MTLSDLVQNRQSVRKFDSHPIEKHLLLQCVEAARLAPSAENAQPWRFIILNDPEVLAKFAQDAFSGVYAATRWASKAPVLVLICAELDFLANRLGKTITGIPYYLLDLGIAGEHFILQAQELGLGTCWIGWFDPRRAQKSLQLPRAWRPVAVLAVGYPAKELSPRPKKRLPLEQICFFNGIKKG